MVNKFFIPYFLFTERNLHFDKLVNRFVDFIQFSECISNHDRAH